MTTITDATESVLTKLQKKLSCGDWAAGQLLPSERRIADELSISRRILRNALQELTRSGQLKRHEPRGYMVVGDADEHMPMTHAIGILTAVASDHWEPNATADRTEFGACDQARTHGSHMVQFNPKIMNHATIQWIKQQQFAGILATHELAQSAGGKHILLQLQKMGVPVVVHGNAPCLASFDRVVVDQQLGMYDLTRWLLEQGCQKIMRLWGGISPDQYWLQMRNAGYLQAHEQMDGTPVEPLHWAMQPTIEDAAPGERSEMMARWTASYLAEFIKHEKKIDAIICVADGALQITGRACEI